jgi:hypothetical protein
MPRDRLEAHSRGEKATNGAARDARRLRNKSYMRRWRANAKRRNRERARRVVWYSERKGLAASNRRSPEGTQDAVVAVCMICRRRPSVREITRLRVCESAPSGFEEVLIPYCGEC